MTRFGLCLGIIVVAAASGCSICCTPFDDAYPAYGGKWERTNRFHGRVGSAFDPAGGPGMFLEDGDGYEEIDTPTPAVPMAPSPDGEMEMMEPSTPEPGEPIPEPTEPETLEALE